MTRKETAYYRRNNDGTYTELGSNVDLGEGLCSDVVVTLPRPQAAYLRVFLMGAVEQMKEACSLKESEDASVIAAFTSLNTLIQQLPEEP